MTDIMVTFQENNLTKLNEQVKQVIEQMNQDTDVESVVEVTDNNIDIINGAVKETVSTDIYSDTDSLRIDTVIKGRRPIHDNEIMITTVLMKSLGVKLGDVVYVEWNNQKYDFIVVGISQGINHFGKKAMITTAGYERLNPNVTYNALYIYVNDQSKTEDVIDRIKANVDTDSVTVANYKDYASAVLSSVDGIMAVLCEVMVLIVLMVIALVLILMIKTQVIRDTKQYGVNKALGYTTGQLLIQTMMSYIPTVVVGVLLGCILSYFGMEKAIISCLSSFGIQKMSTQLSVLGYLSSILGMVAWTALMSVLCSLRIKNISPSKMVREL